MEIQKIEYLENEKSFLDEIKTFFIVFEGLSFSEKYKFDKNSGHKLYVFWLFILWQSKIYTVQSIYTINLTILFAILSESFNMF